MAGPWQFEPYTFRALRKTFGKMWLRCDAHRRFVPLYLPPGMLDRDYRQVTFSCSVCGGQATHTVTHPHTESDMQDYREDPRERPERHPRAAARLLGADPQSARSHVPPKLRPRKGER